MGEQRRTCGGCRHWHAEHCSEICGGACLRYPMRQPKAADTVACGEWAAREGEERECSFDSAHDLAFKQCVLKTLGDGGVRMKWTSERWAVMVEVDKGGHLRASEHETMPTVEGLGKRRSVANDPDTVAQMRAFVMQHVDERQPGNHCGGCGVMYGMDHDENCKLKPLLVLGSIGL